MTEKNNTPEDGVTDTSHGKAFPFSEATQPWIYFVLALTPVGIFYGMQELLGEFSIVSGALYCALYLFVAALGCYLWYWMALAVIAGKTGTSLLRMAFQWWSAKRSAESAEIKNRTPEQIDEACALIQRSAFVFSWLGWIGAVAAGIISLFFQHSSGIEYVGMLMMAGIICWGYFLRWLGRHGYMNPLFYLYSYLPQEVDPPEREYKKKV